MFSVAGFATRLNGKLNSVNDSQLITCSRDLLSSSNIPSPPEVGKWGGKWDGVGVSDGPNEGLEIEADVILIGDLFYDEEMAKTLRPWLAGHVERGKLVLIGDPGRHALTPVLQEEEGSLQLLATYHLTDNCCLENNGFQAANVWKFSTISNRNESASG